MADDGIFGSLKKQLLGAGKPKPSERPQDGESVGDTFSKNPQAMQSSDEYGSAQKADSSQNQTVASEPGAYKPEGDKTDEIVAALEKLRIEKTRNAAETASSASGQKPVQASLQKSGAQKQPEKFVARQLPAEEKKAVPNSRGKFVFAPEKVSKKDLKKSAEPEKKAKAPEAKNKQDDFFERNQKASEKLEKQPTMFDYGKAETEGMVAKELFDTGEEEKQDYKKGESMAANIIVIVAIIAAIIILTAIYIYLGGSLSF